MKKRKRIYIGFQGTEEERELLTKEVAWNRRQEGKEHTTLTELLRGFIPFGKLRKKHGRME